MDTAVIATNVLAAGVALLLISIATPPMIRMLDSAFTWIIGQCKK